MAIIRTSHVDLKVNGDGAYAYVAQPDDDAAHPGVVLVQEWWGIEPHIRDLAQKLAAEGFVVAVPDLYHGRIATEPNDAMKMAMLLRQNIDRASAEIIGALETLKAMPAVEPKKLGLLGFCLGGTLTYIVAARYAHLGAVASFYAGGYDPTPEEVAKVNAPLLAVYGRHDQSIPLAQVEKIEGMYKEAGKDFTLRLYDAGHAFLNPDHGAGNAQAAADAWPRAVHFLSQHLT
ncbi:MAG TPA: dienelactone hydrolase family protein [Ktedonobacteraceae bacterium]